MKYAFWNNKGGVGKTFLCFASACQYARRHPRTAVVVIDMCPQANVSEILLGGNGGEERNCSGCWRSCPFRRPWAVTTTSASFSPIGRPEPRRAFWSAFAIRTRAYRPISTW